MRRTVVSHVVAVFIGIHTSVLGQSILEPSRTVHFDSDKAVALVDSEQRFNGQRTTSFVYYRFEEVHLAPDVVATFSGETPIAIVADSDVRIRCALDVSGEDGAAGSGGGGGGSVLIGTEHGSVAVSNIAAHGGDGGSALGAQGGAGGGGGRVVLIAPNGLVRIDGRIDVGGGNAGIGRGMGQYGVDGSFCVAAAEGIHGTPRTSSYSNAVLCIPHATLRRLDSEHRQSLGFIASERDIPRLVSIASCPEPRSVDALWRFCEQKLMRPPALPKYGHRLLAKCPTHRALRTTKQEQRRDCVIATVHMLLRYLATIDNRSTYPAYDNIERYLRHDSPLQTRNIRSYIHGDVVRHYFNEALGPDQRGNWVVTIREGARLDDVISAMHRTRMPVVASYMANILSSFAKFIANCKPGDIDGEAYAYEDYLHTAVIPIIEQTESGERRIILADPWNGLFLLSPAAPDRHSLSEEEFVRAWTDYAASERSEGRASQDYHKNRVPEFEFLARPGTFLTIQPDLGMFLER